MRAKIVTIVSIALVTIGLIALIQFNASSDAPTQGQTADPVRGETTAAVTIDEYHDVLFQRQSLLSAETDLAALLTGYAVELGLDEVAFSACLANDETVASITEDETEGKQASVNSTPTLFVNGERMIGPTYDELRATVAKYLGQ